LLRLLLSTWFGTVGAAAALVLLLGFTGSSRWLFDLAANLRPQCTLALAVCTVLAATTGSPRLALALALPFVLGAASVAPYAWPRPAADSGAADEPALRLLYFNVRADNPNRKAAFRYVEQSSAEVVVLAETGAEWYRAIEAGLPSYELLAGEPRPGGHFGIALLARRDTGAGLADVAGRIRRLPRPFVGLPAVEASARLDGRPLAILGIHTLPPTSAPYSELRDAQLATLADWTRAADVPVVVLGDLNVTPWSAAFRRLLAATDLTDSLPGTGYQGSWPAPLPAPLRLPIDHGLHSPALVTVERRLGSAHGSDHRPLHLTVRWAAPAPASHP
jgi:endonuclease/exonuclease/phosphatase (EEP) superfamily protein YafD